MKPPPAAFAQPYEVALRAHVAQRSVPDPEAVREMGTRARSTKIPVLEIARLHERLLVMDLLPGSSAGAQATLIRRAGAFFAAVVTAAGTETTAARNATRLGKTIEALSDRTVELAAANRLLSLEITRRAKVETELRKSERTVLKTLEKSEALKERLRGLSRQILAAQEEERKKISRELHDVIAQALAGINMRLATLKTVTGINTKKLVRNISLTQKMITKSADIVHQFARELRPAMLDDLGLIPALHSYMTAFTKRSGVRTHLTVFEGVEKLSAAKRTALYRVAQEALTNVERHARASRVEVSIRREAKFMRMEVVDDGISFQVRQVGLARESKRLGLVGMRERIEMVGGSFDIESAPGEGTKIIANIPISKATERRWREESEETPV